MGLFDVAVENIESSDIIKITFASGTEKPYYIKKLGMSEKEFFEGYSVPRNKELMRVFRDLDLVEHLVSGVPRILRSYGKECFKFTESLLRMTFPTSEQVTEPGNS